MASNSFGNLFRMTTWGESHGSAIGLVIDGCPAGLTVTSEEINHALLMRSPGRTPWTSPRKEKDTIEILSGMLNGKTTGAPISLLIKNSDAKSSHYESTKHLLRPGHANYTYLQKYHCFDYRGGGRSSARETACRVAAGVFAEKFLQHYQITCLAFLKAVGKVSLPSEQYTPEDIINSPIFCPNPAVELLMCQEIESCQVAGDSIGGIVEAHAYHLPAGLGDPVYEKLEANLAKAMLSIPASKGFEIGSGFEAAKMRGSEHNDTFIHEGVTSTNYAGGVLGGISTGMPLELRVAFKPTSSIQKAQKTLDLHGNPQTIELPKGSRHDPCVAIRAVPVVKAMLALSLADAVLSQRLALVQESLACK